MCFAIIFSMTKRIALVTGGAKRIGAAICRGLHGFDMDIIIHFNKSSDSAIALADELNQIRPDSAYTLQADLGLSDIPAKLIDQAISIRQRLDVLINNASVFYPTPLQAVTTRQWQEIMNINLSAPLFLSLAARGHLAATAGCIINLGDIYADILLPDHSLYCISKSALTTLTKSLAIELAPEIRVNAIAPGAILWHDNINSGQQKEILEQIPLGKTGKVEDIVNAVDFLVNRGDYITGQVITIDGGRSM